MLIYKAQELSALRREAETFTAVRRELRSVAEVSDQSSHEGIAKLVFQKVASLSMAVLKQI